MPRSSHARLLLLCALGAGSACREDPVSPRNPQALQPDGAPSAAAPLVFRAISAGKVGHTCGVTTTDLAYCWGNNGYGHDYWPLGDGTKVILRTRPVAVSGGLKFRQVSAAWGHSCGLTTDDRAYCWGLNGDGELGNGGGPSTNRPVPVSGGLSFRVLSAGRVHTCGLTYAGKAYCWGANSLGYLGDGTTTDRNVPVPVLGNHTFAQISAGIEHTCAVKASGEAWCWGANRWGQLGINSTISRKQRPAKVVGGLLFAQISAGGMQQRGTTCAVTGGGKAYCWGNGSTGQRGDGTTAEKQLTPKAVATTQLFNRITLGRAHACALTSAGKAWCWGDNFSGSVGDGTTTRRTRPVRVLGGLAYRQLSAGEGWTCGTTTVGAGYCWGVNVDGTLGDGTIEDRHRPTAVLGPL